MHLRNGNLWTTVDTPDSYDHNKPLSICDIHLAYIGNGQFVELKCKIEPRVNTSITCNTVMTLAGNTGTTSSANENSRNTMSTLTLRAIGTIKLDLDTLDILLSRTPQSIHVSTLHDTTETSLIKPSSVKLRKLSKTDIQLWTTAKTSTKSKYPLNVTQTFIPIKLRKAVIASVSHKTIKQTRHKQPLHKTSSNKLPSVRLRTINKSMRCTTASPKLSSRITRAQKI